MTFLGGKPPLEETPSKTCQRGSHPSFFLSKDFRLMGRPRGRSSFPRKTLKRGAGEEHGKAAMVEQQ